MIQLLNTDNAYSGANLIILLTLILLSGIFFICFSGFVKYNIVLNIIKNAIGTQQIPPTIVVNLLAALMALNAIWPSIKPGIQRITPYFIEQKQEAFGLPPEPKIEENQPKYNTIYDLISHVFDFFPELLNRAKSKTNQLTSMVNIPFNFDGDTATFKYFLGNLLLDLYQGFELGIKLYIVFVSIDFLIAMILSGVGMNMLSPTVISTPVKLAVFYFSDSWTLLFRAIG
ncbi:EscR/YscR/HrcR family type III secretion system export apparatus protein [Photobacterium leiognathi]|uniref:EscR/YscR/HrcR family type III secretion system export apparatus protein n=1 Tax=Photobacterium leiognathi TaxID=553611 RepID=UPI0029819D8D|nr:EscR/YscR/HrcR family type III secretion system export apparatus protein [Photobacterium leiognathi]